MLISVVIEGCVNKYCYRRMCQPVFYLGDVSTSLVIGKCVNQCCDWGMSTSFVIVGCPLVLWLSMFILVLSLGMYQPFSWLFYVCLLFGEFSINQGCYLSLWLGLFLLLLSVIQGNVYQYCYSLLWFRETEIRQYLTSRIYFWRNKPEVNITFCCYFYIMIHWMLIYFPSKKN